MDKEDFEYYHETKLVEALTSIIDQREVNLQTIDYLGSSLKFLSFNRISSDAWKELLQLMNNHLSQIETAEYTENYLLKLSDQMEEQRKKFEVLTMVLTNLFRQNQFDRALEICNRQIDLVEETEYFDLQAEVYRNKGTIYHVSGQLVEGEHWYQKAYDLNPKIEEYRIKDQNTYALANLYQHYTGHFDKAFEYYSVGRDLALSEDEIERETFYLDHMGMAEYWKGEYTTAIKYHKQASEKLSGQDRSINLLFNHVQMGMAMVKMGEFTELASILELVLDLKVENTDPYSNTWYLLLLSQATKHDPTLDVSKFKKALRIDIEEGILIREAKSIAEATKYVPAMVYANIYLAKLHMQEDPIQAMSLLSEAKHLAITNNRHRETNAIISELELIGLDYDTL